MKTMIEYPYVYRLLQVLGIIDIIISSSALLGYVTGHTELYTYSKADVGMAIGTAITFLLIGIVMYFHAHWTLSLDERVEQLEKSQQNA